MERLLPRELRVEKVNAFKLTKPRLIGDIGLRAFFQLYFKAKQLIQSEKINFLYITVPSFYCALLGRWLHNTTAIKYGIDYIDPWVHRFPGSEKIFSRHWLSMKIATWLEPVAVKSVSLVTGVAEGYYQGVQDRNPHLYQQTVFGAMPYGGEVTDHEKLTLLNIQPYLFQKKPGKIQIVYAGAMLPKAYEPLERIFISIQQHPAIFKNLEFHFIGTGKVADDDQSFNIKLLALKYNLWGGVVFEYPQRIPYLDVLVHLDNANAIFILGSTEPHYTPSKTYQAVLSAKPVLAVLHRQSTAVEVLKQSGAGLVLEYDGEKELNIIENNFADFMGSFFAFMSGYRPAETRMEFFEKYSAGNVTKKLAGLLDQAVMVGK